MVVAGLTCCWQLGHVGYLQFCNALFAEEAASAAEVAKVESTVDDLMQQLYQAFYDHKARSPLYRYCSRECAILQVGLRRAFRFFDVDEDGCITPAEFKVSLPFTRSIVVIG